MNESVLMLTIMAAIGLGTPIVFATVGEILAERSGILNLGVQGMMLVGAVMGVGIARGFGAIDLGVVRKIFASWLITIPVAAVLSGLIYSLLIRMV